LQEKNSKNWACRLEDAACGYKGLMVIERCFRSLKRTEIKMMPMYQRPRGASRRM
jgi:transposase